MGKTDIINMQNLKQWEEKNKRIKRTVIVSLILGFFLIAFVIIPSFKVSERIIEKKAEIKSIELAKSKIEKLKYPILQLKKVTGDAQAFVKEAPWNYMKYQLKLKLRDFKYLQAASSEKMQKMQKCADENLRKIRGKIKKNILEPLEEALENIDYVKNTFKNKQASLADSLGIEFKVQIENFSKFLEKWESSDIGRDWYRTTTMLEKKIEKLSTKMNEMINETLFPLVELMLKAQQETQVGYNEKIKNMDVTLERNQTMLINLKNKLDGIIPGWISEILSIELIIQLFPIIIIISVSYMMWNAKLITKHCVYLSQVIGLSDKEREDISLSTVWSLTGKNKPGNMICWLLYFSFFIVMWVYFEMGCSLQIKWLLFGAETALVQKIFTAKLVQWLGRFFFVLLMIYPFRKNISNIIEKLRVIRKNRPRKVILK
jgi:hypothetical protein